MLLLVVTPAHGHDSTFLLAELLEILSAHLSRLQSSLNGNPTLQCISGMLSSPICHPQNTRSALHPIIHIIYENICFGIDSRGTPLPQTINLRAPIKCICKQTHRVIPLHLRQDRQTEDVKTSILLSALFSSLKRISRFQLHEIQQAVCVLRNGGCLCQDLVLALH